MDEEVNRRRRKTPTDNGAEEVEEAEGEEGDPAIWGPLDKNLRQVQSVLDRNRVLIQQVNDNHQSKIPENMVKNVALIREINDNVSRVIRMYSDLAGDLSRAFHRSRKGAANGTSSD
uniref:Protein EARLY FLOWERING 4 domain-containing protein n=1 Tax=Kalanchoe fedtschenkoi TaxID=63787 RepID=A0A7N0TSY5_KALFE